MMEEETSVADALPRDMLKAVVRRLDTDARRALGVYCKLVVPRSLDALLSATLGSPAVRHAPLVKRLGPYAVHVAFNQFSRRTDSWVLHAAPVKEGDGLVYTIVYSTVQVMGPRSTISAGDPPRVTFVTWPGGHGTWQVGVMFPPEGV
jgi:hypothetical protein